MCCLTVHGRYEDTYVDAWLYSDHQRYFFFQQLSTVGALLQLVVHGPGKYSMDEADGPVQARPSLWSTLQISLLHRRLLRQATQVIALTSKGTD